jgi:hypothetical protein
MGATFLTGGNPRIRYPGMIMVGMEIMGISDNSGRSHIASS